MKLISEYFYIPSNSPVTLIGSISKVSMYGRNSASHSCKVKVLSSQIRARQRDNVPPSAPSTIGPTIKNQYPPGTCLGKRATMIKLKSVTSRPMIDIPITLVRPCRSEYCYSLSQFVWLDIVRLTAPHQPVVMQLRIPMDTVMTKNGMRISHQKKSLIIQHNEEIGSPSRAWWLATKSMYM